MSRCPQDISLKADRQRALQVLVNLLSNACEASEAGGSVVVEASTPAAARIFKKRRRWSAANMPHDQHMSCRHLHAQNHAQSVANARIRGLFRIACDP